MGDCYCREMVIASKLVETDTGPAISIIMFFYHIIAFAVIEKHW